MAPRVCARSDEQTDLLGLGQPTGQLTDHLLREVLVGDVAHAVGEVDGVGVVNQPTVHVVELLEEALAALVVADEQELVEDRRVAGLDEGSLGPLRVVGDAVGDDEHVGGHLGLHRLERRVATEQAVTLAAPTDEIQDPRCVELISRHPHRHVDGIRQVGGPHPARPVGVDPPAVVGQAELDGLVRARVEEHDLHGTVVIDGGTERESAIGGRLHETIPVLVSHAARVVQDQPDLHGGLVGVDPTLHQGLLRELHTADHGLVASRALLDISECHTHGGASLW